MDWGSHASLDMTPYLILKIGFLSLSSDVISNNILVNIKLSFADQGNKNFEYFFTNDKIKNKKITHYVH